MRRRMTEKKEKYEKNAEGMKSQIFVKKKSMPFYCRLSLLSPQPSLEVCCRMHRARRISQFWAFSLPVAFVVAVAATVVVVVVVNIIIIITAVISPHQENGSSKETSGATWSERSLYQKKKKSKLVLPESFPPVFFHSLHCSSNFHFPPVEWKKKGVINIRCFTIFLLFFH